MLPFGLLGARSKKISDAPHGLDQRSIRAFQLLPQMANMHIQRAFVGRGLALVQNRRQLIARYSAAGRSHQELENVKFNRGDFDSLAMAPDLAGLGIEFNPSRRDRSRLEHFRLSNASQHCPDTGHELLRAEGFWEIVVRPRVQAGDAVLLRRAGGQHDHGNCTAFSNHPQQLETAENRQHDVENDKVKIAFESASQALTAVIHGLQAEPLGQKKVVHQRTKLSVVLNQKDRSKRTAGLGSCFHLVVSDATLPQISPESQSLEFTFTKLKAHLVPKRCSLEKMRKVAAAALILVASALPPAAAQPPASKSFIGTVTAFKPEIEVEIKPDNAAVVDVKLTADTVAQRVAPGEKTLKNAVTVNVAELSVGDRVLVTLASDSTNVRRIIIMSAADIGKRDEADRQDWNTRGISGIVAAKSGSTITLRIRSFQGETRPTVTVSDQTKFRRYAPDSVKFADARPSKLDEINVGDQLRARGGKTPDGLAIAADEVVFGTFLTTAGSVVSVDGAAKEITIKETGTGQPLVIRLTPDSRVKQMPSFPGMGGAPGAGGGPPPPGGSPSGGFGGPPGGGPTLAQMVEMMPTGTLEDVKPGQTVIVSSTKGATSDHVTGIMLLANAEMLVRMATAQSGAGAAAGNRTSGAGGLPQGMPTGAMPSGMDLGGMLGGIGLSGMGP